MNTQVFTKSVFIKSGPYVLRDLLPSDVSVAYLSWFSDPVVQEFIVTAKTTTSLDELRRYVEARLKEPYTMFLGIFDESGKHLGNLKYDHISVEEGHAIMGILIGDTDSRGKGISQIVLQASARYLKANNITKIYLGVDIQNQQAIRAYEKLGFSITNEGPIRPSETARVMVWDLTKESRGT